MPVVIMRLPNSLPEDSRRPKQARLAQPGTDDVTPAVLLVLRHSVILLSRTNSRRAFKYGAAAAHQSMFFPYSCTCITGALCKVLAMHVESACGTRDIVPCWADV